MADMLNTLDATNSHDDDACASAQSIVHDILRDKWLELEDEEKEVWRKWALWHKKRYRRDLEIYTAKNNENQSHDAPPQEDDNDSARKGVHVPKKRHSTTEEADGGSPFTPIPKKSRHN